MCFVSLWLDSPLHCIHQYRLSPWSCPRSGSPPPISHSQPVSVQLCPPPAALHHLVQLHVLELLWSPPVVLPQLEEWCQPPACQSSSRGGQMVLGYQALLQGGQESKKHYNKVITRIQLLSVSGNTPEVHHASINYPSVFVINTCVSIFTSAPWWWINQVTMAQKSNMSSGIQWKVSLIIRSQVGQSREDSCRHFEIHSGIYIYLHTTGHEGRYCSLM